jgi:NMD protein affecting ribosome stability and mRNA decay
MKNPGIHVGGKSRVRELIRRRGRSHGPPVASRTAPATGESTLCARCGAVYGHKTWRRSAVRLRRALAREVPPSICPACAQVQAGLYRGRVVLRGSFVARQEEAICRRIANVAARARFTQPERRVVSVRRDGDGLEVRTTSEKLAHRIARELEKAFGGRTCYVWSHRERTLLAIWRNEAPDNQADRERRTS